MHQVLIRPLITEKMSDLTADHRQYGFIVNRNANKIEIAKLKRSLAFMLKLLKQLIVKEKQKLSLGKAVDFPGKLPDLKKQL